jgi:hypothetical protein
MMLLLLCVGCDSMLCPCKSEDVDRGVYLERLLAYLVSSEHIMDWLWLMYTCIYKHTCMNNIGTCTIVVFMFDHSHIESGFAGWGLDGDLFLS